MSQEPSIYRTASEKDSVGLVKQLKECQFERGLCADANGAPREFMIKTDPWGNPFTHCPFWRDITGYTYKAGCMLENEKRLEKK